MRYKDNLLEGFIHKKDRRKYNKLNSNIVIDIKTNKIYKNVMLASEHFPVSGVALSPQINGSRPRQSYNTLYRLNDLIIHSDGYAENTTLCKLSEVSVNPINTALCITQLK